MPYATQQAAGPHAVYRRGWWYRDVDDYMDTLAEYAADERASRFDEEGDE